MLNYVATLLVLWSASVALELIDPSSNPFGVSELFTALRGAEAHSVVWMALGNFDHTKR